MKTVLLIISLTCVSFFSECQQARAVEICNTSISSFVKEKDLKYDTKNKAYFGYNESGDITDFLQVKNEKIGTYRKIYYYVTEEQSRKALSLFIDDSFQKDENYTNEDNLNIERWLSFKNKVTVAYVPEESFRLSIYTLCPVILND